MMMGQRWSISIFLLLLFTSHQYILAFQTENGAKLKIPFRQFTFAPNDVCIQPKTFYVKENVAFTTKAGEDPNLMNEYNLEFTMRNVPGEGDCVFLAVALATSASMGLGGNSSLLRAIASETRGVVADVLSSEEGTLHVEGRRIVRARDLLNSASKGEGVTPEVYLKMLRSSKSLQGGGPELTVLANVLRRPITIYELDDDFYAPEAGSTIQIPDRCKIKPVGTFGDMFTDPCANIPNSAILSGIQPGAYSWHVHILVVDSGNGEKHACTLLPKQCYI